MQTKWKKALAVFSAMTMCAGMLAGCGQKSAGGEGEASGDVTIKFVHKFPEEQRMKFFEDVIAQFEEANPGIKVEMTAYGDEEIKDKTRVLLGSADAPDIFFTWSGERITQYVDSGNALDISQYFADDSAWKDSFNQAILDCCVKNDSYWAVPWDYSCKAMVYNKKIFAEAGVTEVPQTWAQLLEACQKVKDAGYIPIAIGNQYPWVVCHYLTSMNGKLVPADVLNSNYTLENPEFTDAGYAQALDLMKELYDKGYVNEDVNSLTWEMSQAMVQESKAAMVYEENQNLVNYETALGDDWGYFNLPEIDGAKGETGYITGGPDVFMVNSESKHPDEAIKFLKWITSDAVQSQMAYDLGFLPCTGVELDAEKVMPELLELSERNLQAPGISEWLDCAMNQTVADTYLIGCQTIFEDQTGADVMASVTETAKEEAAE